MQRRLRPVTVPQPVPPPPGVADRRRSRRLWGLGVEAQVQLSTAMRQLLVALDQADADDPEAHEAIADARLLLARAIGDIQAVLGELADLKGQVAAVDPEPDPRLVPEGQRQRAPGSERVALTGPGGALEGDPAIGPDPGPG